jgi:hypothetical protein
MSIIDPGPVGIVMPNPRLRSFSWRYTVASARSANGKCRAPARTPVLSLLKTCQGYRIRIVGSPGEYADGSTYPNPAVSAR